MHHPTTWHLLSFTYSTWLQQKQREFTSHGQMRWTLPCWLYLLSITTMVTTPKMDGSHMSTMLLSRMYMTSAIWTSQKKAYHLGAKLLTSTMRSLVRYCHRVVLVGIEKIISYQLIVRMSCIDMWRITRLQLVTRTRW